MPHIEQFGAGSSSGGAPASAYTTQSKSANFTAATGFVYLIDSTSGAVTVTLPSANVSGQTFAVKWSAGTNAVTLNRAGSDTIGPSATSATMGLANEVWEFVSSGSGQWNLIGGNKPLSSLDARYARTLPSGFWRASLGSTTTTAAMSASVERAQPIILPPGTVLQAAGVNITATAASSVVRLGIRQDEGGRPGTLLADWGTIDSASSTGIKTLVISYTTPAGSPRLWLTATAQGGAPTVLMRSLGGSEIDGNQADILTNGSVAASLIQTGVTGALPGPFTSAGASGIATLIAVQAA